MQLASHLCSPASAVPSPSSASDVLEAVHEPRRLRAHVPARPHVKLPQAEGSLIWRILSEPRLLGLFSPRRTQPGLLGSLSCSSVQLRRCMRKLEPQQRRRERLHVDGFQPGAALRPGPFGEALPPTGSCRRRQSGARRLALTPDFHGAFGSSRLPPRTPSHHLLRQQLLHCVSTARSLVIGSVVQQAVPDRHTQTYTKSSM